MSLTLITNEVVQASSVGPDNLSFGAPQWDASGVLTATKFIGDGSGLTNVFPGLSVVEVTDNFFQITPDHNNAVLALNSSSDILLDLDFIGTFVEGHKTTLVQVNQGKGIVGFPTYNSSGFDRTQGIYSVGTLLYGGFSNGWTLYGDLTAQVLPDTSGNDGRATQLAAGEGHSLVLAGNALYVAGDNLRGQLGLGDSVDRSTFTRIAGTWNKITTGRWSSLALSGTDWYVTGDNPAGVLGLGDTAWRSTFTKLAGAWTNISMWQQAAALSGTDLYVVGSNEYGELGLNSSGISTSRSTFTRIAGAYIDAIATSSSTVVLSANGDLYSAGNNAFGQLGLGDTIHRSTFTKLPGKWTSIAKGVGNFLALSGTDLYSVGSNQNGQLGIGTVSHRSTLTKIPGSWTSLATSIYAHSLALSGTDLYAAGQSFGSLGLGDSVNRSTFTKVPGNWSVAAVGYLGSLALSATGNQLFSTGSNGSGQLGLGDIANRSTFTRVSGVYIEYSAPALPRFTQIAAGGNYTLALSSGGDLFVIGQNSYGVLGIGDNGVNRSTFTKVVIPANAKWTAVAAGYHHSFALSGTDLYGTGQGVYGAFGVGNQARSTFTRVPGNWTQISTFYNTSLALSGTDLYSTGGNDMGQLGINEYFNPRSTFTKVTIPTNAKWTAIAAGLRHSLALSGTDLYGCGSSEGLGLNLPATNSSSTSTFTKVLGSWTAIAAGADHSLALSGTDLYATGTSYYGQLGLNLPFGISSTRSTFTKITIPANAKWTAIAAGMNISMALSGTDLYVAGQNDFGQLGLLDTNSRSTFTKVPGVWTFVTSGPGYHSLALSGTSLFGTGQNTYNQLGLNGTQNRSTFTQVTAVG